MRRSEEQLDASAGPDPSHFFRTLRETDLPEEFWAGFWPSVRAGIRNRELQRDSLTATRAFLLGSSAGLMAAAALLALTFLAVPWMRPAFKEGSRSPGARSAAVGREEKAPPPILEDLQSASARVYTFHVGGPADATDVILIVDEKIDI